MKRSSQRNWAFCDSGRSPRLLLAVAALLPLLFATACPPSGPPAPPVPTDAQDACPLSAPTFAGWFHSGSVSLNGVVDPANSLISLTPDCDFYSWSERMFLWLTSPAPATYGGGGVRIFNSPTFYDVSPPDASGNRTFIQHSAGLISQFPLRSAQVGAHGLPVIMDSLGRLIEVQTADTKAVPQVRDQAGNIVQIAHARIGDNGKLVLLDAAGNVINALPSQRPAARDQKQRVSNTLIAQKFVVDGIPIFIDPALAVITVEQGQAGDSGVLESQTGSLVYYATMVNDVYAYYLTGQKKGTIVIATPGQFPTVSSDLNSIIAFATANGKGSPPFLDPNALAIEVKSAWVLAQGLPNLSSYITMTAMVPAYKQVSANTWTQNGSQSVQLALVGIHVVGSVVQHPEMVWATFEHAANDPLGTYTYNSISGSKTINQNTNGTWLFTANGSSGPFNVAHMSYSGPPSNTIQSASGFTISPSDTLRTEPWGTAGNDTFHNTEVIAMNNHVLSMLSMLASGDVRGNYFMTGATWIAGGGPPSTGFQVGNASMTNTTMETYQQGSNCLDCHSDPTMLGAPPPPPIPSVDQGLSHIYEQIKPLF
jgi:hypothetical protein